MATTILNPHSRQLQGPAPLPHGTGLNANNSPKANVKAITNPLSRVPKANASTPLANGFQG